MKTWILALIMMMGFTATAQHGERHHEKLKPEQRVELQVKKMTLKLDLDEKQQKEIKMLLTEKSKKHEKLRKQHKANKEAGKKLTADERFAMKSKRLDEQIVMKKEMKKILTPKQFEKFEKMKMHKERKITKKHKKLKKHQER
ncbi:MAG: hypothetical protein BM557_04765 [Flavobacterium sp. MedPE-SWcel]|uniref:hypothetical protein n=1 Tax=uncultured Flavobacterium sp. TaxID=165435 RepID=UPI0009119348|nr:hypothetical protein [uncultured Flavobacterium sp.]OIQ21071.1 MAG: hypothetical protein BM557_04765 [Flavobacterium sp. MedPE-SWcel]